MPRVAIITDSSADLPPAVAAREGIVVVPAATGISVAVPATAQAARVGVASPQAEPMVAPDAVRPEIVEAFVRAFTDVGQAHDAVVAVLLSGRLGGVVEAARRAREQVLAAQSVGAAAEAETDIEIEIVDSRSASLGLGFQALRAAELARDGVPADTIAVELRAATDRYHVVFSVESVEHLRQSGQIGRAAAMIAEALQLKPLLRIDEGQIVPYERARTRARAIAELAEFVRQLPAVERCTVLYATSERDAKVLAEVIGADTGLPPDRLTVSRIGETVAAQVGPGALGIAVAEPEMR